MVFSDLFSPSLAPSAVPSGSIAPYLYSALYPRDFKIVEKSIGIKGSITIEFLYIFPLFLYLPEVLFSYPWF
jgi:hypothetical protein